MKIYVGRRSKMTLEDWLALGWGQQDAERYLALDQVQASVVVLESTGVRALEHHVRHSPTGFEWGYVGSGPAELARCILIEHYFAAGEPKVECYQQFKRQVIAKLDRSAPWSISDAQITAWAVNR